MAEKLTYIRIAALRAGFDIGRTCLRQRFSLCPQQFWNIAAEISDRPRDVLQHEELMRIITLPVVAVVASCKTEKGVVEWITREPLLSTEFRAFPVQVGEGFRIEVASKTEHFAGQDARES